MPKRQCHARGSLLRAFPGQGTLAQLEPQPLRTMSLCALAPRELSPFSSLRLSRAWRTVRSTQPLRPGLTMHRNASSSSSRRVSATCAIARCRSGEIGRPLVFFQSSFSPISAHNWSQSLSSPAGSTSSPARSRTGAPPSDPATLSFR